MFTYRCTSQDQALVLTLCLLFAQAVAACNVTDRATTHQSPTVDFWQTSEGQFTLVAVGALFGMLARPLAVFMGNRWEDCHRGTQAESTASRASSDSVTNQVILALGLSAAEYGDYREDAGRALHDMIARIEATMTYKRRDIDVDIGGGGDGEHADEEIRPPQATQDRLVDCIVEAIKREDRLYQAASLGEARLNHGLLQNDARQKRIFRSVMTRLGPDTWRTIFKRYFNHPCYTPKHAATGDPVEYIPLAYTCHEAHALSSRSDSTADKPAMKASGDSDMRLISDESSDGDGAPKTASTDSKADDHNSTVSTHTADMAGRITPPMPDTAPHYHDLTPEQALSGPPRKALFYGRRGVGLTTYAQHVLRHWATSEDTPDSPLLVIYLTEEDIKKLSVSQAVSQQRIWEYTFNKAPNTLGMLKMVLDESDLKVVYLLDDISPLSRIDFVDYAHQERFKQARLMLFRLPNVRVFSHHAHLPDYPRSVTYQVAGFRPTQENASRDQSPQERFMRSLLGRDSSLPLPMALSRLIGFSNISNNPTILALLCSSHGEFPRVSVEAITESMLLRYYLNHYPLVTEDKYTKQHLVYLALGSLAMYHVQHHSSHFQARDIEMAFAEAMPDRPHFRDIIAQMDHHCAFRATVLPDLLEVGRCFSNKTWRDFFAGYYLAHTDTSALSESDQAFLRAYADQPWHPAYRFYVYWLRKSTQNERAYAFVDDCKACLGEHFLEVNVDEKSFSQATLHWLALLSESVLNAKALSDRWNDLIDENELWFAAATGGHLKILSAYLRQEAWDIQITYRDTLHTALDFAQAAGQVVTAAWLRSKMSISGEPQVPAAVEEDADEILATASIPDGSEGEGEGAAGYSEASDVSRPPLLFATISPRERGVDIDEDTLHPDRS